MAIATSQQLNKYYEIFKNISVTYTKEIVLATGLQPNNVFLKCLGTQWPCVIHSCSFAECKVLATSHSSLAAFIAKANNIVSVRFSFKLSDTADPIQFYVSGKAFNFSPYEQSNGTLQLINIQFTQRPPDDLVEIVGRMLEANVNSARRSDERILITPESMRKIGLAKKETMVVVDNVPRNCIIRELAFSSAKVILVGLSQFLDGKICKLRLELEDPSKVIIISGTIVRIESVEGRKDLTAIAIRFDAQTVPMIYKMHLNDYLSQKRGAVAEKLISPSST